MTTITAATTMARSPRRRAAFAVRLAIVLVGAASLAYDLGLGRAGFDPTALHYFTDLSNFAAVAFYAVALVRMARPPHGEHPARHEERAAHAGRPVRCGVELPAGGAPAARAQRCVICCLALTFVVANGLLAAVVVQFGGLNAQLVGALGLTVPSALALAGMHYVVPVLAFVDWALFAPHGDMRRIETISWLAVPLAYIVYIMVFVNVLGIPMGGGLIAAGSYPYPFLDGQTLGWPAVVLFCAALCVLCALLGCTLRAADRALARRVGRERPSTQLAGAPEGSRHVV